jgi:hypothetical protein
MKMNGAGEGNRNLVNIPLYVLLKTLNVSLAAHFKNGRR